MLETVIKWININNTGKKKYTIELILFSDKKKYGKINKIIKNLIWINEDLISQK